MKNKKKHTTIKRMVFTSILAILIAFGLTAARGEEPTTVPTAFSKAIEDTGAAQAATAQAAEKATASVKAAWTAFIPVLQAKAAAAQAAAEPSAAKAITEAAASATARQRSATAAIEAATAAVTKALEVAPPVTTAQAK